MMNQPQQPPDASDQLRTILVAIGGTMLFSLAVYTYLAWQVTQGTALESGVVWTKLHPVLLIVAVCDVVLGLVLEKRLRPRSPAGVGPAETGEQTPGAEARGTYVQRYVRAFVVSLACYASVAIYGLLLVFLGMSFQRFVYWVGASALLQVALGLPKIPQYVDEMRQLQLLAARSPDASPVDPPEA